MTKELTRRDNGMARSPFRTRNYKHELVYSPDSPRFVGNYSDEAWHALCKGISGLGFNGLVFYGAYHPFEYILDYKDFPRAASKPAALRDTVRGALCRGLAIAHAYGLTTFMQHYVTHFTESLRDSCGLKTAGRCALIDHPEVDRYVRYCYREIFRQLPDLDGLFYNFESCGPATDHLLRTALPELNAMKRRPIALFRLWTFPDIDEMRRLLKAYKGRKMVCHKISDTNDVYYLPVADSRVRDWKKLLGMDVEWLYEIGPCHNCGTNLCGQVWSDYQFVQDLLGDAVKKGADSIGFHTVNEFFAPRMDPQGKIFPPLEHTMARHNWLHLQAVADFSRGERKTPAQQARVLADRVGVPAGAGAALRKAILASSQLVLLTYQQFCYGSDVDGYLSRGRYSHIQEPFCFYPASEMNGQTTKPMWTAGRLGGWIDKKLPSRVVPEGFVQYIIDFVNPDKPRASRNPQVIASMLARHIAASRRALASYARLAGKAAADQLAPHIHQNALLGDFVRHEISAAISLYRGYFARSKPAMRSAMAKGLAELQAADAVIGDKAAPRNKVMQRVLMLDRRMDVTPEIAAVAKTLMHLNNTEYPFEAFRLFVESRRLYNEMRRNILPIRLYDPKMILKLAGPLRAAVKPARQSCKLLAQAGPACRNLADNVQAWLVFLENEISRLEIPAISCSPTPPAAFTPLQHHHCFRRGESFAEDFLNFFEPCNYIRPAGLAFGVSHTASELVVTLREQGDVAQRMAQWERLKADTGSCAFCMMVHMDVQGKGRAGQTLAVWPKGETVHLGNAPKPKMRTKFEYDDTMWQTTVWIPFAELGVAGPRAGDIWGFNVTSNPFIAAHSSYTWAPQFDSPNPKLYGRMRFV